ncbi:hypothetical protein Trco_003206 [Trichoderma cornu-damae]|uniref:Ubiquitin-like domain-containing protein n=1 Tax=Trichoderma cornu-damae TaxID=654480 RepID=A0A9P8QP84_9HYPO|nr:hypothetical protein Trco_003206 [Trichoderma cornu-damae]
MGCCFSRPAGPNSPYPGGVPDASSRAINPPPLSLPEGIMPGTPRAASASRRRRRDPGPLDQHINRPLRRHEWTSSQRRWTRRELIKEREEFFDTRVVCRPEIWQTLHAALQVLWEPHPRDPQDDDGALATAQTILDAAEISLPTGNLVNGAYDSLGNLYALPEWIVADPDNLADEADPDAKGDASTAGEETVGEEDDDDDDVDSDETERRREEKGKGVLDEREMVTLRARLSETGRDINVTITKSDSVRSVIKKIAELASLPPDKKIRLAYMGKMLKESSSLEAQGWHAGHVINALVFNR